jgi:hypothetical protein
MRRSTVEKSTRVTNQSRMVSLQALTVGNCIVVHEGYINSEKSDCFQDCTPNEVYRTDKMVVTMFAR